MLSASFIYGVDNVTDTKSIDLSLFNNSKVEYTNEQLDAITSTLDSVIVEDSTLKEITRKFKNRRLKAILFTLLTGPLGGHRIYLGTHQRTPVIYSLTLGGFGILPLIDLVHIIFTKDLTIYDNKPQIIMWGD